MAAQLPQLAIDLGCRRERQRRLIREKTIETVNREIDRCLMPRRQTVDELLDRLGAMSISVVDSLRAGHSSQQSYAEQGMGRDGGCRSMNGELASMLSALGGAGDFLGELAANGKRAFRGLEHKLHPQFPARQGANHHLGAHRITPNPGDVHGDIV